MKRICAIFCLDDKTKDKIQGYRDELTLIYGIPRKVIYPHITLAHYIAIDREEIIKYSEEFVKQIHSIEIQYDSIEVLLGNCIACIVNANGKITDFYNKYHLKFDNYCDKWTKKESGLWIPHSTIYGKCDLKLEEMKKYLKKTFTPFKGKVTSFELSQINEEGFEIIYSKNFK